MGVFPLFQSYRYQGLLQSMAMFIRKKQEFCKLAAEKASRSPLQKPEVMYCPWEDKPEPWNMLLSSPIFTSRWPLRNKERDMKYVPEPVSDDKTMLVDHANPFMSGPQVLLGALLIPMALQRTRFSFRCLILLKDLRRAQRHKLFFSIAYANVWSLNCHQICLLQIVEWK